MTLDHALESGKKIYVLHHDDTDGFGAAWAFWLKLLRSEKEAVYLPVQYEQPMPKIDDGSVVYILDFSYPRQELIDLKNRSFSLTILDHHITSEKELAGLDFAQYNNNLSGAYLAWLYAHPDQEVPVLIKYIQDRDLWQWKLENSREVNTAIYSHPYNFYVWNGLDVGELAEEGRAILRMQRKVVEQLCKKSFHAAYEGTIFPVVNTPVYQSEVCEALLKDGAPLAACFFDEPSGLRVWSLRSNNKVDVSQIAVKFGGGGHKNAAGFSTDSHFTLQLMYNTYKL